MNRSLWIVQVLLAVLFLVAGGLKLVRRIEAMTKQVPLPGMFLRFIGVADCRRGKGERPGRIASVSPRLTYTIRLPGSSGRINL
jgi:hypothetical protein